MHQTFKRKTSKSISKDSENNGKNYKQKQEGKDNKARKHKTHTVWTMQVNYAKQINIYRVKIRFVISLQTHSLCTVGLRIIVISHRHWRQNNNYSRIDTRHSLTAQAHHHHLCVFHSRILLSRMCVFPTYVCLIWILISILNPKWASQRPSGYWAVRIGQFCHKLNRCRRYCSIEQNFIPHARRLDVRFHLK